MVPYRQLKLDGRVLLPTSKELTMSNVEGTPPGRRAEIERLWTERQRSAEAASDVPAPELAPVVPAHRAPRTRNTKGPKSSGG